MNLLCKYACKHDNNLTGENSQAGFTKKTLITDGKVKKIRNV